jgi:hypothetical protein
MTTNKRTITPHKGGRTERINARIRPDVKQRLRVILNKRGISFGDWLELQIESENESQK